MGQRPGPPQNNGTGHLCEGKLLHTLGSQVIYTHVISVHLCLHSYFYICLFYIFCISYLLIFTLLLHYVLFHVSVAVTKKLPSVLSYRNKFTYHKTRIG